MNTSNKRMISVILTDAFISVARPLHIQCSCGFCSLYDIEALGGIDGWRYTNDGLNDFTDDEKDWLVQVPYVLVIKTSEIPKVRSLLNSDFTLVKQGKEYSIFYIISDREFPDTILEYLPCVYDDGDYNFPNVKFSKVKTLILSKENTEKTEVHIEMTSPRIIDSAEVLYLVDNEHKVLRDEVKQEVKKEVKKEEDVDIDEDIDV
jgi:hypothetical protein